MDSCSVRVLAADGCWCKTVAAGQSYQFYGSGVGGVEEFAGEFGGDGLGCVFEPRGGKPVMLSEKKLYCVSSYGRCYLPLIE